MHTTVDKLTLQHRQELGMQTNEQDYIAATFKPS